MSREPSRGVFAMSREVVGKDMVKWYHKPAVVFIAIIGFGPFAIPLIWASPIINKWQVLQNEPVAHKYILLLTVSRYAKAHCPDFL